MSRLEKRLDKIEESLFPTYATNSGACKLANKYNEDFEGDTLDALKVIDEGIRDEAKKHKRC